MSFSVVATGVLSLVRGELVPNTGEARAWLRFLVFWNPCWGGVEGQESESWGALQMAAANPSTVRS